MVNIREWRPTKRQEDFLTLPDSVFEALYGGAAGGGKSECLLLLPLVREFYKNSDFKGLILRRTYPELERELIIRSNDFYPQTGAIYNESKKRWHWPAFGSYLQFGYAEHEKDVRNYDTAEYNYIAFDELTSFTEFQYKYIAFSRCRSKADSGLPAIVRSGTNPGNVGHGHVRARFVEPAPTGYTIIQTRFNDDRVISRIYIPAKATDNPHVDPQYIDRLSLLPEAERKAKLDGDWWTFTGQVFDDWRVQPFADEPSNAQHVIKPFPIPDFWPRVLSIDWGFAALMWAGFAAISPDRRIYLFHEYACRKTKISTWATDIGNLVKQDSGNFVDIVLDPSAWHQRGDEFTIAEQFAQYSGLTPRKADNDRLGGKILLQECLRWRSKPSSKINPEDPFSMEHAEWLRRNRGKGAYESYVNGYLPETPEPNIPILQVFDTCTEFIRVIPLCVYNDPTKTAGKNPEDVAEFDGDDPYDGGRYLIKAARRYLDGSCKEAQRREEIAKVCAAAVDSVDKTSFYINMANLESKQRRQAAPMRRQRRYARRRIRY